MTRNPFFDTSGFCYLRLSGFLSHGRWHTVPVLLVLILGNCRGKPPKALPLPHFSGAAQTSPGIHHQQVPAKNPPTARDVKALQASLKEQKQVLAAVTAGCLVLLVAAGLYMRRLVRRDRERQKETDAFLRAQLEAYDEKILRMLIVNAGYEEIKARLKKEFNFDIGE